jgi:hypothetical protein
MNWIDLILGIEIGFGAALIFSHLMFVRPTERLLKKAIILNDEMLSSWKEMVDKFNEMTGVQHDGSVKSTLQPFV